MEKNIQQCSKKIIWLVYFTIVGLVGLYFILAYNFYRRRMYYMIIAQTVLLLFHIVILGQCTKKRINLRIITAYYLGYLIVVIILNATLFSQGSFLTPDIYMGNQEYDTVYEYYEQKYISSDEKMAFTDFRALSLSVFYDFLKDKEVIVDDSIVNDEIVYYLVSGLNNDYDIGKIKEIKEESVLTLKTESPKQIFRFYTGETELLEDKELFLFTGEEWNASKNIYMFACDDTIYAVPDELLQEESIIWENSERKKPTEDDIITECTYASMVGEADATILKYSQVEETCYSISIRNLIFGVYILSIGLIALFPLFRKMNSALIIFLSYPLGAILHVVSVILVGSFDIQINLLSIIITAVLISILYNLILLRISHKMEKQNIKRRELLLGIVYSTVLIVYFSFNVNIWMSYDSFMSIYLAKYIVYNGEYKSILGTLSSFSLGTPILNTGAILFGIDLSYAFQPIMTFMGMGAIIILLAKILLERYDYQKKAIVWISVIALLLLASTPMFNQSKEWMHNNMTIGIWFGISAAFLVLYYIRQEKILLAIAFPYLLAAALIRIEGPLFATVLLVCLKNLLQNKRVIKGLSCGILICSLLQFILYYQAIGFVDSKFWTPSKSIAMLSILTAYVIYLLVEERLPACFTKLNDNIDFVMLVAIGLAAIAFSILNYNLALSNIMVLAQLFFGMGYYGGFVFCVIITIIVNLRINIRENRLMRFYHTFLVGFILVLYDLVFFRKPLHNNSGDSSCRMLLHISFVACMFIAFSFWELFKEAKLQRLEGKTRDE